jgi:nucleotide-binding universal stress UspA family protein
MSIKDLLVVLDPDGKQGPAHTFAQSLAEKVGAHLTAVGVALQFVPPVSFAGDYPYDLLEEVTEQSRKALGTAYETLRTSTPAGVQTDMVMIEALSGVAAAKLGELARHFDITIVGQDDLGGIGDEAGLISAALLGSGRPVLIVPFIQKGPAKIDHAIVAWDGGLAASRALAGAMPVLEKCSRVEVVTIAPKDEPVEELPGFNITRHLARHGVNAELCQLGPSDDIGAAILAHATNAGADLLVMGGYGHSRVREFIFGGTTRQILSSMTLPVLMAH